jgi:hypothetical protein
MKLAPRTKPKGPWPHARTAVVGTVGGDRCGGRLARCTTGTLLGVAKTVDASLRWGGDGWRGGLLWWVSGLRWVTEPSFARAWLRRRRGGFAGAATTVRWCTAYGALCRCRKTGGASLRWDGDGWRGGLLWWVSGLWWVTEPSFARAWLRRRRGRFAGAVLALAVVSCLGCRGLRWARMGDG